MTRTESFDTHTASEMATVVSQVVCGGENLYTDQEQVYIDTDCGYFLAGD